MTRILSRDKVEDRTNRCLNIFEHYLQRKLTPSTKFLNPLYNDTKPDCNVYLCPKSNTYKYYDHGCYELSGDAYFFVGRLYNVDDGTNFVDVLRIINRDMGLGIKELEYNFNPNQFKKMIKSKAAFAITPDNNNSTPKKIDRRFTLKEQPFKEHEEEYWMSYGITTQTLKRYRVCSIAQFTATSNMGREYTMKSSVNEPMYGYQQEGFVKIYRPCSSTRFSFIGEKKRDACFGLEQLPMKGDAVFITGGEKDTLSLAARGFNAVTFGSESNPLPEAVVASLTHRFKHVVLLYDMDKAGIECSEARVKELSKYGVMRMELPLSGEKMEKDVSDYFKIGYTRQDFAKLFVAILDKMYEDTMSMLRPCEINISKPPRESRDVVSVADVPLGTAGNLFCITGGEGTGKSHYIASIIAGCITEGVRKIDTLGLDVAVNRQHKAVLLYDTEQSESQIHKNIENLMRRAKLSVQPPEFKPFYLSAFARKERLKAIMQSIDRYHHLFGGTHLVVIDGVADLVRSANDEGESVALVEELYNMAGMYNTCIVAVLHFVPNGIKLRGHLGSELQRKSSAILSIERDKEPNVSVVKAIKVRDGSPFNVPLMQFAWDKEARMHLYLGEKSKGDKEERKREELKRIVAEIFADSPPMPYNELMLKIVESSGVSERTAKSYIKYMRDNELIIKDIYNDSLYLEGL